MLIVWPGLPWLDDRVALATFLIVGAIITTLVFRNVMKKVRKHHDEHPSDD